MSNTWAAKKGDWAVNDLTYSIDPDSLYSFRVSDNDAEPIMTITNKGEVIWNKSGQEQEAAQVFCDYVQMNIESEIIKQTRYEWEERILDAMKKRAEIEPLDPEVLTDVFKKCIMIDKLKGIR